MTVAPLVLPGEDAKKILPFSMGRHDGRAVEVSAWWEKRFQDKKGKGNTYREGVKGTSESEEGRPVLPF